MSKAFTREDDAADDPLPARAMPVVPSGAKNYITSDGAERLRSELDRLISQERPPLVQGGEDRKRELQMLDARIRRLQESFDNATVVPPPPPPWDHVRFGADVTVRESDGTEVTYRLVGVDETDLSRDWISWCSPLAKALLNRKVGEQVNIDLPAGKQQLEIVRISYG